MTASYNRDQPIAMHYQGENFYENTELVEKIKSVLIEFSGPVWFGIYTGES
jgi:hypothetical protein